MGPVVAVDEREEALGVDELPKETPVVKEEEAKEGKGEVEEENPNEKGEEVC